MMVWKPELYYPTAEPKLGKLAQTKLLPITVNQAAGLSPESRPSEYNLLLYNTKVVQRNSAN